MLSLSVSNILNLFFMNLRVLKIDITWNIKVRVLEILSFLVLG